MRSVGAPLRIVVVTLDRGQNDVRQDAPATILRNLGHQVLVAGYDFAELDRKGPPADIAVVEAGLHLEIGRDAIKRLRARPELLSARVLVCVEVGRVSGLDPETGADDFILMPVNAEELTARLAQLHARDKRPGLLSRVWGYRHVGRARTVDTHVLNLRTKMGRLGDRLQSVRGLGYKLLRSDQTPGMALSAS